MVKTINYQFKFVQILFKEDIKNNIKGCVYGFQDFTVSSRKKQIAPITCSLKQKTSGNFLA